MKLFEITEFDDEEDQFSSDFIKNHKNLMIKYMWKKLYFEWDLEQAHSNSKSKEKIEKLKKKMMNKQHLWAEVPQCAYYYAIAIIEKRFPEGEKAIASDRNLKLSYEQLLKCTI